MRKRTMSLLALSPLLALGAQAVPAQAATTTWAVANPDAQGKFTASGPLVAKNAAGQTLFTCTNITLHGEMKNRSTPNTSNRLGEFKTQDPFSCTGPGGAVWNGVLMGVLGNNHIWATGFDAATGTTSILAHGPGAPGAKWPLFIFTSQDASCGFLLSSLTATYDNSTSTLETATAKVDPGGSLGDDVIPCDGLLSPDETITFAGELAVTPAIQITATTS